MRGRSYSYSPSPPRGYSRRGRSPSPRGRYGGRGRDLPTSLLVRNLRHDCRPEDLRRPFGEFGPLKDIYLPRDYYTGHQSSNKSSVEEDVNVCEDWKGVGFEYIVKSSSLEELEVIFKLLTFTREPRGFGFVQYIDPADAAEAKHEMDGQILHGRELTVVFAEENRKKPADMRARQRSSGRSRDRRRSPPQYSRSPRYVRSRSRSPALYSPSPRRRHYSRSVSPQDRRYHREPSYSRSPPYNGSRSRSRSPSPSPSRSQSRTPDDYPRKLGRERSLSQ